MLPSPAALRPEQRQKLSLRVKALDDLQPWPELSWWNSAPCSRHPELAPGCMKCGIRLRKHQRVGAAWMYLGMHGLLTDTVGSGKTAQVVAMLAMCKETGELGTHNRAVVVCQAAAVGQWAEEIRRMVPGIPVIAANGTPSERLNGYLSAWEIAVVSDRTFSAAGKITSSRYREGDVGTLVQLPVGILVYDDIDAMRNLTTKTYAAIERLARQCSRVAGLHGTPLQKRLMELYSFLSPVGGRAVLGTASRCRQRYVVQDRRWITVADPRDPTGRTKKAKAIWSDSGVNDSRIAEFRQLIDPLVLRRTAEDLDDVELPAVQVNPVFLDLSPRQRKRYDELRSGVLRRMRKTGLEEVSYAEAAAAFTRGWQICSGLAALDDGQDDSAKLDWVMDKLTGDLEGDKSVCFVYFRENVRALSTRLKEAGLGHVLMWSEETDSRTRDRRLAQFREDPDCRVLVGTPTIERSLNLQAGRHLIAVDTILNPARMEQIVGRVRRQNSAYSTVFFHHLLARDTQEDGYLPLLRREQAIADAVWDEKSEIWQALGPRAVMNLVAYGNAMAA
jgi:SNF2 family DNA or RNA helicase